MKTRPVKFFNMLIVTLCGPAVFACVYIVMYITHREYLSSFGIEDTWLVLTAVLLGALVPALCVLIKSCYVTRFYPTVSVTAVLALGISVATIWWCHRVMVVNEDICWYAYIHLLVCILVILHATCYVSSQTASWYDLKEAEQYTVIGEVPEDQYDFIMTAATLQSDGYTHEVAASNNIDPEGLIERVTSLPQ